MEIDLAGLQTTAAQMQREVASKSADELWADIERFQLVQVRSAVSLGLHCRAAQSQGTKLSEFCVACDTTELLAHAAIKVADECSRLHSAGNTVEEALKQTNKSTAFDHYQALQHREFFTSMIRAHEQALGRKLTDAEVEAMTAPIQQQENNHG